MLDKGRRIILDSEPQKPSRLELLRAIQQKRYVRALSLLVKAETRLKRAKTLFRKYDRQVSYYKRVLGVENGK